MSETYTYGIDDVAPKSDLIKRVASKLLFVLKPGPSRAMMSYVAKNLGGKLVGAEIGVAEGYHAFKYLSTTKCIYFVYLVDPYLPYEMDGDVKDFSKYAKDAKERLSPFRNKIDFVYLSSEKAAKELPDNLDFVYIDANHSYESTKNDIMYWYPKVRAGGVLGGHDFSPHFPGVAKAVLEFIERNKLKLQGSGCDWWIVKRET